MQKEFTILTVDETKASPEKNEFGTYYAYISNGSGTKGFKLYIQVKDTSDNLRCVDYDKIEICDLNISIGGKSYFAENIKRYSGEFYSIESNETFYFPYNIRFQFKMNIIDQNITTFEVKALIVAMNFESS
jgi:hypothetical protein